MEAIMQYIPYIITGLFILNEVATIAKVVKQSKLIKLFDSIKLGNKTEVETILNLSQKVGSLQSSLQKLESKSNIFDKAEARFSKLIDRFEVVEEVVQELETIGNETVAMKTALTQAIDTIKLLYDEGQTVAATTKEVERQRVVLGEVTAEIKKFNSRFGVK